MSEHRDRLEMMAVDKGETWDLSPNDQKAIKWALDRIAQLEARLPKAWETIAQKEPVEVDQDVLAEVGYRVYCETIGLRPRDVWNEVSSDAREGWAKAAAAVIQAWEKSRGH